QNPFECAALALGLGLSKIFGQELKVEPQRAEVVLDFVDEAARQLGQLSVAIISRAALSAFRHPGSPLPQDACAVEARLDAGAAARHRQALRPVARAARPCATA